jgi:hypothetical protein
MVLVAMEVKGMAKGDREEEDGGGESIIMSRGTSSHNCLGRRCLCKEIDLGSPPWLQDEEDAWGGLLLQLR